MKYAKSTHLSHIHQKSTILVCKRLLWCIWSFRTFSLVLLPKNWCCDCVSSCEINSIDVDLMCVFVAFLFPLWNHFSSIDILKKNNVWNQYPISGRHLSTMYVHGLYSPCAMCVFFDVDDSQMWIYGLNCSFYLSVCVCICIGSVLYAYIRLLLNQRLQSKRLNGSFIYVLNLCCRCRWYSLLPLTASKIFPAGNFR